MIFAVTREGDRERLEARIVMEQFRRLTNATGDHIAGVSTQTQPNGLQQVNGAEHPVAISRWPTCCNALPDVADQCCTLARHWFCGCALKLPSIAALLFPTSLRQLGPGIMTQELEFYPKSFKEADLLLLRRSSRRRICRPVSWSDQTAPLLYR